MVMRGQFLERPALIPVESLVLEGLSHRGQRSPPLLIVPPAPNEGGMDHVVAAEVAWAVATAGHPTLRFNFRGVGASQGKVAPAIALADVNAALDLLLENAGTPAAAVLAIGGSAQAALALAADMRVAGVALVSPRGISPTDLGSLARTVLVIVGALEKSLLLDASTPVERIPDTDAGFQRNLPMVGRSVVRWLQESLGRSGA